MSVIYRIVKMRSNPLDKKSAFKYYPKAITLGQSVDLKFMVEKIHDISSVSRGDIRSVVYNFVEKLKEQLLEGKSVNVDGLGVFSLSLRSNGEDAEKKVDANSVTVVRVCFSANKDLRISKTATRAGEQLHLIRVEEYLQKKAKEETGKSEEKDTQGEDKELAA